MSMRRIAVLAMPICCTSVAALAAGVGSGIFETDPTRGTLRAAVTGAGVDIITADAVFRF